MITLALAYGAPLLAQIDFTEIANDRDRVILTGIATILALIALLLIVSRIRRRQRQTATENALTTEAPPLPTPEEAGKTTLMSGLPQGALIGISPQLIAGQQFLLNRPVTAIGRSTRQNQIRLDDASVSRHHSRIYVRDGDFIYRDLNSPNYNPSSINGQVIDDEYVLQNGDRIKLGTSVLQFLYLEQ